MKTVKDISGSIFFNTYDSLEKLLEYYNFKEDARDYDEICYLLRLNTIDIHIATSINKYKQTKYYFSFPAKRKTNFGYDYMIINQDSEGYANSSNFEEDDVAKILLQRRLFN